MCVYTDVQADRYYNKSLYLVYFFVAFAYILMCVYIGVQEDRYRGGTPLADGVSHVPTSSTGHVASV